MKISKISKSAYENLKVAVLIGKTLFFLKDGEIYSRDVYNYDNKEHLQLDKGLPITDLSKYENNLVIIRGSILEVRKLDGSLIDRFLLRNIPKMILHTNYDKNAVSFLYGNGDAQILYDGKLENIRAFKKSDLSMSDLFVSLCLCDDYTYILGASGCVYECSHLLTKRLVYGKPLKMIPEPTQFVGEIPTQIGVCKRRIYVVYETGYEVYKKEYGILNLIYTYKSGCVKLHFDKHAYCIEDKLVLTDEAPVLLLNQKVDRMFENVGICKSEVIFVEDEKEAEKDTSKDGVELMKERDTNERTNELF
jgi:hypothetical protein